MSSVVIQGDTSGSITVTAPAVAGTYTNTLPQITGTLSTLDRATAVTASGTSVEFTSIPANVKRITVALRGISTNGTGAIQIQLGTSGGYVITTYLSTASRISTASTVASSVTTGFSLGTSVAAEVTTGNVIITNITGNVWVYSVGGRTSTVVVLSGGGDVDIGGTLDRLRIIGSATGSPADTFDAGSINILYE